MLSKPTPPNDIVITSEDRRDKIHSQSTKPRPLIRNRSHSIPKNVDSLTHPTLTLQVTLPVSAREPGPSHERTSSHPAPSSTAAADGRASPRHASSRTCWGCGVDVFELEIERFLPGCGFCVLGALVHARCRGRGARARSDVHVSSACDGVAVSATVGGWSGSDLALVVTIAGASYGRRVSWPSESVNGVGRSAPSLVGCGSGDGARRVRVCCRRHND